MMDIGPIYKLTDHLNTIPNICPHFNSFSSLHTQKIQITAMYLQTLHT